MNEHWQEFPVKRGFETIRPIYDVVAGRAYIGGSYAAFMGSPSLTPVLPNDVDIFATSDQNAEAIADELFMKLDNFYCPERSAIGFDLSSFIGSGFPDLQILQPRPDWKFFPEDILGNFDLDICRAVLIEPGKVLADKGIAYQGAGKVLRINDPLRSLKRIIKYAARGVSFNDHELLKLFQAWDQVAPVRKREMIAIALDWVTHSDEPVGSDDWNYDDDEYYDGE